MLDVVGCPWVWAEQSKKKKKSVIDNHNFICKDPRTPPSILTRITYRWALEMLEWDNPPYLAQP